MSSLLPGIEPMTTSLSAVRAHVLSVSAYEVLVPVSQSRQLRCCPSSCFMKLCFCFPVLSFHFLALESCFVFYFRLLFVYFCRLFHPLFHSLWLLSSIPSFFRSFPSFFPLLSVTHSSRCFSVWTSLFLHFYLAVLFSFFRPFFSVASSFSLSLFPGFFSHSLPSFVPSPRHSPRRAPGDGGRGGEGGRDLGWV